MTGYKAFNKNLCCRGFQFEVGRVYTTGRKKEELTLCSDTVFHFCRELHRIESESDYKISESRVCEVIATGDIIHEGAKFGTNEIRILRELTREEINEFCNRNSGDWNSGNRNSGDWNSGDRNSGDRNSGDWNSGNRNSGDWNSGNRNSGDWNSGDWNSGDWNSGDWNSGDWNSGNRNSGNRNSGNRNSGDWNSGDWNSGDWNFGFFNTGNPVLRLFNRDTDVKREDISFPSFLYFDLTVWVSHDTATDDEKKQHKKEIEISGGFLKTLEYKEAFALAYEKADKKEHEQLFSLPNFNPAVFEEISGIDTAEEYAEWKKSNDKE